jgi:hypothetical protein
MSSITRRRGKSLHLELPGAREDENPPIGALFLIQFDVKAGYTIAWKKCVPGLDIAESVEFKSLPSGLHDVEEDLVYFMHNDEYAGISAFVNRSAEHWDRNALMLAVGALVPLENGRLGRSWKHAEKLRELAEHLVIDPTQTQSLDDFWEDYKITEEPTSATSHPLDMSRQAGESSRSPSRVSVNGRIKQRDRGISSASGPVLLGPGLSPHHPALSLPTLLDTFGPLVYPLYKAALLRKRILMVTKAPVELSCNFVYDISILSNIPSSIADLLPLEPLPTRLKPLFSVGVHDIDTLAQKPQPLTVSKDDVTVEDPGYGWVACTTDNVLGSKPSLYDILVTIPPSYSKQAKEKVWPKIEKPQGGPMKASQRDLRRYRTLKQELRRSKMRSRSTSPYSLRKHTISGDEDDEDQALLPIENTQESFDDASSTSDDKLIEPLSWSALAYSSFMWWASAGEKRADLDEEIEHDAALFTDYSDWSNNNSASPRSRRRSSPGIDSSRNVMTDGAVATIPEMAIIAYFHRLTALILGTLAQVVDAGSGSEGDDGDVGDGSKDDLVYVGSEDMGRMGLDVWSEGDRKFVEELLEFYWGRKAEVQGGRIDCCGVRIC